MCDVSYYYVWAVLLRGSVAHLGDIGCPCNAQILDFFFFSDKIDDVMNGISLECFQGYA